MQVKPTIPKRQPTIVCEDIADDDDFLDDDDFSDSNNKEDTDSSLLRSASTASLTVPVVCEDEVTEKRRPPFPDPSEL